MSTLSMTYLRMSNGVAGLKTRPLLQPVERMSWSVRSTCVFHVMTPSPRAKKDAATCMRRRLGVERNIRSPRVREVLHDAVDGRDHEMHVDGRRDAVLAQRRADHGADR